MSDKPEVFNSTSGPVSTGFVGLHYAHCWHYKVNAPGPGPQERCCHCGTYQYPRSENATRYGHGAYA